MIPGGPVVKHLHRPRPPAALCLCSLWFIFLSGFDMIDILLRCFFFWGTYMVCLCYGRKYWCIVLITGQPTRTASRRTEQNRTEPGSVHNRRCCGIANRRRNKKAKAQHWCVCCGLPPRKKFGRNKLATGENKFCGMSAPKAPNFFVGPFFFSDKYN